MLLKIILALLTALLGAECISPAFESLISPPTYSPFSSYSYNVLNPGYGFSNSPQSYQYSSPRNNLIYIPFTQFNSNSFSIFSLFNNMPGYSGTSSIVQLKKFQRDPNGARNNLKHPEYNSAHSAFVRHSPALYKDGSSIPISSASSPRESSNALGRINDADIKLNPNNVSMAFVIWGQFMDHDVGLSEVEEDPMPIRIPMCDPFMDSECSGDKTIPFKRSKIMPSGKIRSMMNSITGWVDASNVYGSTEEVTKRLRTFQMGKLKEGEFKMLPLKENDSHGLNDAGDTRVNENLFLTSYHTIFVREHNRLCNVLLARDPTLTDEEAFQAAKNYVTGIIQKITYEDFLPILLGRQAYQNYIGEYKGYDSTIDPSIDIEFTTTAYRFGHSLLVPEFPLINRYGETEEKIKLHEMFFRPDKLTSETMQKLLRGLSRTICKVKDGTLINGVRNLLITDPESRHINMDLYALNIQRGRDHGIEKFNYLRMAYGFPSLQSFEELTGEEESGRKLQNFYKDVNEIDPWVGILNEKPIEGGILGEVGARIVGLNFKKLRNGDRFWYENQFPVSVVAEIRTTKLSEVIIRNTGIFELQEDIFHFKP